MVSHANCRLFHDSPQSLSPIFSDHSFIYFSPPLTLIDILSEVRKENSKLKYRRDFLKQQLAEAQTRSGSDKKPSASKAVSNGGSGVPQTMDPIRLSELTSNPNGQMTNVNLVLKELFNVAIASAFPEVANDCPAVVMPSKKVLAYQISSAMKISNSLKSTGQNLKPKEVADRLIQCVPANDIIESLEAAPQGFINIKLSAAFLSKEISNILIRGIRVSDSRKERVVVDLSSPNIAKEMHVGHLRSTIIGDCLANVLEFVGHDVVRINHVGDWGTQFGMLLAHLMEKYPDCLTSPPPIADLQSFYREAKKRFDEEEEFKIRAYAAVVRLQSKDTQMIDAWKLICDISRKEFQSVYELLGIKNLIEKGESFYQDKMIDVVRDLESRGFLKEEEGRKLFFTKSSSIPLTIVKSDGGFTYDTSDMATLKYRVQEQKADRVIYVVDLGQALHFDTIFGCAAECGYYDSEKVRVQHVGFGVVLGEDKKKFKTRSGDTVRLKDLLQEGLERARAKLVEKNRASELSEDELKQAEVALAYGCIKYADLKQDRNHEYEFSFDRMLDDRGNTAVYLLYNLTRIRSIKRNANIEKETSELAKEVPIRLSHERELKLAHFLIRFPEIIIQVAQDLFPHTLCSYLYELSTVFSEFYDVCYCIEKTTAADGSVTTNVNMERILLCEATALVLDQGLALLGLRTVSKM